MEIKTALVVDDSRVGRISLTKLLEKRDIQVVQKESGAAAIDYLRTHPADVVFIDYMMPEMDGVETARRLGADPATAQIPLYLYTGEEAGEAQRRAQGTGIKGFLSKPTPEDQLDRVLAEAAAGRVRVAAPAVAAGPDPAELHASARQAARAALDEALAGPLAERIGEAARAAVAAELGQLREGLREQAREAAREAAAAAGQETLQRAGEAAREAAEVALRQALPAIELTARREVEGTVKSMGAELWRELDRQLGAFLDSPALRDRLREVAPPTAASSVDEQAVVAVARRAAAETADAQAHEVVRSVLAEQAASRSDSPALGQARAAAKQALVVAGVALAVAAVALVAALLL